MEIGKHALRGTRVQVRVQFLSSLSLSLSVVIVARRIRFVLLRKTDRTHSQSLAARHTTALSSERCAARNIVLPVTHAQGSSRNTLLVDCKGPSGGLQGADWCSRPRGTMLRETRSGSTMRGGGTSQQKPRTQEMKIDASGDRWGVEMQRWGYEMVVPLLVSTSQIDQLAGCFTLIPLYH